ncbi:hypothetical protein M378DRAFT_8056 [Amanita muscaria Koide BX008]|uniref:Uncharacterized protein n=1 Tax=Amanita muscaria (strain Koide BX008) TaxID=946122 RepID=A0A0C2X556_AMAMK|nr:hypothetical protein M378DRAFT_8056 [Amanita muscaria Koide BX008]
MFPHHPPRSPLSSPPSSPPSCIDSSPPQSPPLAPVISDDYDMEEYPAPPQFLVDPLAASVKAILSPPQYERRAPGIQKTSKRARVEPATQLGSCKKMKYHYRANDNLPSSQYASGPGSLKFENRDNTIVNDTTRSEEASIWEDACTRVFDGHGTIDLCDCGLTRIPRKFIEDLGKIYILPDTRDDFHVGSTSPPQHTSRTFMRSLTAPADVEVPGSYLLQSDIRRMSRTSAGRVRTVAEFPLGIPKGQIALLLANNRITSLPKELFALEKLTILSIRSNRVTYLPPEIKYLTNLHTLNVANNQLRYLPCEMLEMSLEKLHVHPNPWLQPSALGVPLAERPLSEPIHPLPRVIPLVEVCLRRLLSPTSDQENETLLASHFELPLPDWFHKALPERLRMAIEACVPGSFYRSPVEKNVRAHEESVTGLGHCPCSQHPGKGSSVFVVHAEERFTWETRVGNVEVGERVAIKWRGCSWGCLDFLEGASENREVSAESDAVQMMDISSALDFD